MWPWEHIVIGYIAYSLVCHLLFRNSPSGRETFAVVFGSLLPDLIDKPLAWQFGVFEGGYAIAHSVFFAIPLSILAGFVARRYGVGPTGLAFGLGYLLHLLSELLPAYLNQGELVFERILWPVMKAGDDGHQGLVKGFVEEVIPYAFELTTGEPSNYLLFQLGLMGFGLLLWIYDDMPILREAVLRYHLSTDTP